MSTARSFTTLTVSALALTLTAMFAAASFPLQAQKAVAPSDANKPVSVVQGGEHLLHGTTPEYPRRALQQNVEGDVVVDMTLNDRGEVWDARVVSGPEELRRSVLEAVLQWHYSPSVLRSTDTQATLRFRLPAEGADEPEMLKKLQLDETHETVIRAKSMPLVAAESGLAEDLKKHEQARVKEETAKDELVELRSELEEEKKRFSVELKERAGLIELKLLDKLHHFKPNFAAMPRLLDVRTEQVSESIMADVLAQAGVSVGDAIGEETAKRIVEAAGTLDEHVHAQFSKAKDGVVLTLTAR